MKDRIDKLEQKYMDWRNHGTKAFEKATGEELPVFTRKADEEIVKLKARIAELEKFISWAMKNGATETDFKMALGEI